MIGSTCKRMMHAISIAEALTTMFAALMRWRDLDCNEEGSSDYDFPLESGRSNYRWVDMNHLAVLARVLGVFDLPWNVRARWGD